MTNETSEGYHLTPPGIVKVPVSFTKNDQNKPELSYLPLQELEQIALVLDFGAKKYARDNWKKGTNYMRMLSSAMRHLFAFIKGEDNDSESGLPHLAHLGCCILFLMYYQNNNIGQDDR
jgi:hypothetical protein